MTNLLASLNTQNETHLIIGASTASSIRITSVLESGASPILLSQPSDLNDLPSSIQNKIQDGNLIWKSGNLSIDLITNHLKTLGRPEVDNVIDRVFVTLPISQKELKHDIYTTCKKLRIPINTSDSPEFSTFTLLSTFTSGDFQLGVSTSGKGCKLAAKIKRELANSLPPNIGEICDKIGKLRKIIQEEDQVELQDMIGEHDDDAIQTKLNSLVKEFEMSREERKLQRTRWLSQIVEYFPLNRLGEVELEDLKGAYKKHKQEQNQDISSSIGNSPQDISKLLSLTKKGSISLVGSGPGSVSLLTLGALQEINTADLILADKLVPQQVLDLIPRNRTKLFIARKFPGNAERAQQELLEKGLEGLERGEKVVRLKQGDPYIFGRGGEEYNYFKEHGFTPVVLPGITSALAAPVLANIPATHRDVADQVLICTGTGRRGVLPNLPEFNKSRTTVFLMALHRVAELIPLLILEKGWDPKLPVAIIERGSCPDQRVIRTTLENVANAVASCGSRPPGLLVTGYACEVIQKPEGSEPWVVEEGYKSGNSLESFLSLVGGAGRVESSGDESSEEKSYQEHPQKSTVSQQISDLISPKPITV